MLTPEVLTWIAAGVAVLAVVLAGWQLRRVGRQARHVAQQADRADEKATAAGAHAEAAAAAAERAQNEAHRAWEQVKLASEQLQQAQEEHRASDQAEQWEWAYALTSHGRELVEASQELVRTALDTRVAPHYRLAADRYYRQSCQRWQDTMVKALSRTSPTLELQHRISVFAQVQQRLHGHIDVLLRAAETGTLPGNDAVVQHAHARRQELANAYRQLQRTVSGDLATPRVDPQEVPTQHITASVASGTSPTPTAADTTSHHGQQPEPPNTQHAIAARPAPDQARP
ncbi:hypothetical protein [Saccharopolyspora rosea]|uniref:Uncharacterized protein n=1 Tax=Saccharopolyspora rosea TaxID=524884 RepID=A0ABW3FY69_9PSEU|nr:hypothetical protein [Saccharopolyspora rosea]